MRIGGALLFLIAVTSGWSQQMRFAEPHMASDSLVLTGGLPHNEYAFPVARRDALMHYERFGIMSGQAYAKTPFRHWEMPVMVYIDKNVPNAVRRDFSKFIRQFKGIDNLKILEVGQIEKANYHVQVTDEILSIDGQKDELYQGTAYRMLEDNLGNCQSAVLLLNPKQVPDAEKQKHRLRQFFYSSLCFFAFTGRAEKSSLLSKHYDGKPILSDGDRSLLRTHYALVNQNIVNPAIYDRLRARFDALENPEGKTVKIRL